VALDVADYNQKMFRWYMGGGYNSHAGNNPRHDFASWQQAVVATLPGGPSGQSWTRAGEPAWNATASAFAAIDEWINAPPKVEACRPFDWRAGSN
jgi:hypothetical protein